MLPRSKRISIQLFKDIVHKGEVIHSPYFIARCVKSDKKSRFAVSVSKKVAKTAVLRNKIRRQVYSIIRDIFPSLSANQKVVLMMKSGVDKASLNSIKLEIEKTFVKCGLLK